MTETRQKCELTEEIGELPVYTIITPVYNEAEGLRELYRRVREVLDSTGEPWESVLVNDGSTDTSVSMIAALHKEDARVRGISLSRNYGFQIAVTAGLDHAQGRAVILMDADLQDPPEVILDMIAQWHEGYDVIYGVRGTPEGETWFKKTTASVFYRLIHAITHVKIPVDTGDFRLMDRRVVDAIPAMPEHNRFLRGMVSWIGYRQTGVTYTRQARFAGKTHFTLQKMLRFALDAVTGFSYLPLQLSSYFGFGLTGISALVAVPVIFRRLFGSNAPLLGQTTILVTVLFLGGIQLVCLGIIGEYMGRIYDEVKARPLYLIDRTWGIETC